MAKVMYINEDNINSHLTAELETCVLSFICFL